MTYVKPSSPHSPEYSRFLTLLHTDPAGNPLVNSFTCSMQPDRGSTPCSDPASWVEIFSSRENTGGSAVNIALPSGRLLVYLWCVLPCPWPTVTCFPQYSDKKTECRCMPRDFLSSIFHNTGSKEVRKNASNGSWTVAFFYRWSNWLWLISTLPKLKLHDQHIKYLDVWVWHQLLEPWCRILNVTLKFYPDLPIWTSNQYLNLAWIELGNFGTEICSMKALKDIAICQFSIEFWHHSLLFEQGLAHH